MEILFWIWVLTWMFKTAATDVLHAAKGTPNPRYELKREKARAAGQPVQGRPRYGTREWLADLYSDALAANTERRRAKAQPIDSMIDAVKESKPTRPAPPAGEELEKPAPVVHDGTSTSYAKAGTWAWSCRRRGCPGKGFDYDTEAQATAEAAKHRCPDTGTAPSEGVQTIGPDPAKTPAADTPTTPDGEQPKLATVIPMFPILKESTMANAEITGLPTAIAFAEGMTNAHRAAFTAGGEQYVAALRGFEVGDGAIAAVEHAREMSAQAAAAWATATAEMKKQNTVKEAYQAVPDAGNKRFVTGE